MNSRTDRHTADLHLGPVLAAEAIKIAEKHLAGASIARRKALAEDITRAITECAHGIAIAALRRVQSHD